MKEQIEKHELSESIYMSGYGLDRKDCDDIAEQLYHEGYREQSEPISCGHENGGKWISVEDRLPEDTGTYLTWHRAGYYGQHEYNAKLHGWNVIWYGDRSTEIKTVTHWMPLPEPPKMKGGAE